MHFPIFVVILSVFWVLISFSKNLRDELDSCTSTVLSFVFNPTNSRGQIRPCLFNRHHCVYYLKQQVSKYDRDPETLQEVHKFKTFHNNTKMFSDFFPLTNIQWSFSEDTQLGYCNRLNEETEQSYLLKTDIKEIWKNVKQYHTYH